MKILGEFICINLQEKNLGSFKEGAVDARDGVAFVTLSNLGVVGEGLRGRDIR